MVNTVATRRSISLVLIAMLLTGCSRAVVIPREDVTKPAYREPGSYRIQLQGSEEYLTLRFSVTDSTVVITELLPSDERYRTDRAKLPITIPLSDVASISEMKTNWPVSVLVVGGLAAVAGFIAWFIVSGENDSD